MVIGETNSPSTIAQALKLENLTIMSEEISQSTSRAEAESTCICIPGW